MFTFVAGSIHRDGLRPTIRKKMKRLLKTLVLPLLLLTFTPFFASCGDEDWWTAETLEGSWRIVEVQPYYMDMPYREGDIWEFQPNGNFYAWGSGGFNEYGRWEVANGRLRIDFDYDGREDVVCYLNRLDDGYASFDVTDYMFNMRYTLRMVRESW